MGEVREHSMTWWSGLEVTTDRPDELRSIEQFYRDGYRQQLEEGLELGTGRLHELIATGSAARRGPRFLSSFSISHDQVPRLVSTVNETPSTSSAPTLWLDSVASGWSLLYNKVAETVRASALPFAIYFVGVNPPAGLDAGQLAEFNDFYTSVHLPEVASRRQCLRASRYELVDEIRAPRSRAPRYLAVYEMDEQAASNKRHIGGPYATGPEVWRRHTTPWRLWYRLLSN